MQIDQAKYRSNYKTGAILQVLDEATTNGSKFVPNREHSTRLGELINNMNMQRKTQDVVNFYPSYCISLQANSSKPQMEGNKDNTQAIPVLYILVSAAKPTSVI